MDITKETRFRDILSLDEFRLFRDYLNPVKGVLGRILRQMRMSVFQFVWNADSICEGLQYMYDLCRNGEHIFYPLYEESQAKEEKGLTEQVMFHFPVKKKSRFVVVCAGGSYSTVNSINEAFPVAKRLNEMGYHAFVVNYRTGKYGLAPNPQNDLAKAIRYILSHSEELQVERGGYAIAGFSAGGHLAASFGTQNLGYRYYGLPGPSALFLAYPVITMTQKTHFGSRYMLLGKDGFQNKDIINRYSVERQITEEYPPVFMWQCDRDKVVPIENTQLLMKALKEAGVEYEYKTFSSDAHGWGLAQGEVAEGWLEEAVEFWERVMAENDI